MPNRVDAQRLQPGISVSPYVITVQQPDGSDLRIIGKVDMQIAYTETEDGYTILKNEQGYYEYAERYSNGALKLSGIKAKNKAQRRSKEKRFLQMVTKHLRYESPYLDTLKKEKPFNQ